MKQFNIYKKFALIILAINIPTLAYGSAARLTRRSGNVVSRLATQARPFSSFIAKSMHENAVKNNQTEYPELIKCVKKYECPYGDSIQRTLEKGPCFTIHGDKMSPAYIKSDEFDITGFIRTNKIVLKGPGIDRVVNNERIQQMIKNEKLHHLTTPKKYLWNSSKGLITVADKINIQNSKMELTLPEIQELVTFGLKTGHVDWKFSDVERPDNIARDDQGKILCIDTEKRSFYWEGDQTKWINPSDQWTDHAKIENMAKAFALGKYRGYPRLNQPAQEWLDHNLNELKTSPEGQLVTPLIHNNSQYDKAIGINFTQALQEYEKYTQQCHNHPITIQK